MKPVRKAVRTFLIKENKVLVIKYITNDDKQNFYDIPGGKIEDGEAGEQTAIREFIEEAGIEIFNPLYAGNLIVEYNDRIFDMKVYLASDYNGVINGNSENIAEWITIDKLLKKEKKFPEICLLDKNHKKDLLNKANFKWRFICDSNHNIIDEIHYNYEEKFYS